MVRGPFASLSKLGVLLGQNFRLGLELEEIRKFSVLLSHSLAILDHPLVLLDMVRLLLHFDLLLPLS